MTPDALPPLREVIARHGLDARRSLGQHFLLDGNLTARIAQAAENVAEGSVLEVGPGPGGLTRALLEAGAARIAAVERDPRCVAALAELTAVYPDRLQIIEADALEIDFSAVVPPPRRIVANLPYNVATPLLIGWLRGISAFAGLTLMFQKEVADRLTAEPGSQTFGRLSVVAQRQCRVQREFNVDAGAFVPPPKITSTVVSFTPHPDPLDDASFSALEAVTAAAFGQRRKMLRTTLKPLGLDLAALGIDPTQRAEDLTVEAFCVLADAYAAKSGESAG